MRFIPTSVSLGRAFVALLSLGCVSLGCSILGGYVCPEAVAGVVDIGAATPGVGGCRSHVRAGLPVLFVGLVAGSGVFMRGLLGPGATR